MTTMTPAQLSWLYLEQKRRGTAKPIAAKKPEKRTLAQLLRAAAEKDKK